MIAGANAILDIVDAAPVFVDFVPDDAVTAEDVRKFGLSELDAAIAIVRAAAGEARGLVLQASAQRIGQLAAACALHEGFARAALEEAASGCGLIRDDGARAVKKVISDAIKLGKKQPCDLSEVRGSAVATSSSSTAALRALHQESRPREAADIDSSSFGSAHPVALTLDSGPSFPSSFSASVPPPPPSGKEANDQTLANEDDPDIEEYDDDDLPPDISINDETFRLCAELDQSDVDNGQRLIAYFGRDLLVRQEDDVPAGQMLAWTGTHWDLAGGEALARLIGQRVGNVIKQEAAYIDLSPTEARAVNAGDVAAKELKDINPESTEQYARVEELTQVIAAAKKARSSLSARRAGRRKWGISSKNSGRVANMLKEAAPHLRRHPDAFNANALKVATLTHTLTFVPKDDPDNPDPDGNRPLVIDGRVQYRLHAKRGHDRDDLLTAVIPYAWDPKSGCREFNVFLDLFQPEAKKRRTVQQYSGMSLTAQPVQRVMFHTGTGGNGKSVFLEVLARVFGDGLAVGLPSESVSGQVQNNPSAPTPDIARCYAKRYLRVAEMPKDAPLKMDTIKKLTGGEKWPVRTMYKGYFEFKPTAKPHMSGNGEPKFDGADGGMKRRLIIVEWSVTLASEKHRDFEDVVSEIVAKGSGILNWLIAGALDFLNNGLVISEDVQQTTDAHFAEMDPCQQYIDAHVRSDPGGPGVTSRSMYDGYKVWAEANGMAKMFETRFGRTMKKKLTRDDTKRVHVYVDVALHDLPESTSHSVNGPQPHDTHPHDGLEHEPF
jgi:putative DNA primase/helicase